MKKNLKRLFHYYKPYKFLFLSDLFFAVLGAAISLAMPLIVRHITSTVVYFESHEALRTILIAGAVMVAFVLIEMGCNYYMVYYGHMMGVRMEGDMRKDIFSHDPI